MSTAKASCILVLSLVFSVATEAQIARIRSPLDDLLDRAVAATQARDFSRALELYRQLEESDSPWHAWAGTSGQVALHRMMGDGDSARAITARIAVDRPEMRGLMSIWDGDTSVLEGDLEGAAADYQLALDLYGSQWVDGKAIGATALQQLSRVRLELGDARGAAESQRQLLQRYPRFADARTTLAKALAFESMEAGELPLKPLEKLLHDGDCTPNRPCVFSNGRLSRRSVRGTLPLAGGGGIQVLPDAEVTESLDLARTTALAAADITSAAVACTPAEASDGFQNPIVNSAYGYKFMTTPDCCGGWHPGVDLNGAGDDCGLDFNAVARGCVRDVMSSSTDWGTAAVEHAYAPGLWTSQYGHGDKVYYSVGQAIAKGAALGNVDKVGRATGCHLHFEIREEDHPARNDASSYHNSPQATVGDEYQDPELFIAAHRAYQEVRWVDEESFSFTGTWQAVTGVGDQDDLKYGLTTTNLTTYARYEWTRGTSGNHEVWAFVPWNHATSTKAPIKVVNKATGASVMTASVNQSIYYDAWVKIGAAVLSAGTTYYIEVATNTGESSKKVAVDDFLIIRTDTQGGNCIATVPADRWKGEYFNNRFLSGNPSLVRDDGAGALNFDWGPGSPDSSCGIGADNFSARFTRTVSFSAGTYRFSVTGDDGVRLYVDGVLKLDKWFDQGATTYTVDVPLSAGNHTLKLEYYENGGYAVAKLSWQLLNTPAVIIVDDLNAGFVRYGPSQYWWQASLGYANHMFWTYVNGTVKSNYARWTPNLAAYGAGNYKVSVFIPRDNATSQQAKYLIFHAGQSHFSAPVNQSLYYDQWLVIGTYYFSAAGGEFIELADATGEAVSTYRKLGFDAVKFEK
jgi:murein DD-endopeptidase MepM/ murein hydrolase activator NlpD